MTTATAPATPQRPDRNLGIDTLRGLACLLLVGLHVIGIQPEHGLRVPNDHAFAVFSDLFVHLRMPLFAMLSGFVYAWRPARRGQLGGFMRGKLARLGLPFLFAAGSFATLHSVLGGGFAVPLNEFWTVFLMPYVQFWFLQAILILFAVIAVADALFPRAPFHVAVGMLVVSGALFLSPLGLGIDFLSIEGATYLAPFFAFGVVLSRAGRTPPKALLATVMIGTLLLFAINAMLVFADPDAPFNRRTGLALSLGLCFSGTLIMLHRHLVFSPLAWIGKFSFTIYLYHMFPIMALQLGYDILGRPVPAVGLALGVTFGIAAPIVLHLVTARIGGWPSRIALGLAPKKAKPATPAANPAAWPETGR
ncbi:acyltransferase family protein [Maricaulis sp. CAU 1757]